jgi:hypothetical protein
MSFGVPPDPGYVAFRDGLLKANNDVIDKWRWRWSAKHAGWFTYAIDDWILDDVGLPDTAPGSSFDLIKNEDPTVELARTDTFLPDVYARVQEAHSRFEKRWPYIVWTWRYGGDWRSVMARPPYPVPPDIPDPGGVGPSTGDDWMTHLNQECVERVEQAREWVRRGYITSVDGQRLIRAIVEECT